MSGQRLRSRNADILGYAFSADGSLDPGTKLLDVGLHEHTPIEARRALLAEPLHMSVAIHELTHFVSLGNSLGDVMGFLAMRAKTLAGSIDQAAVNGEPIDDSWIALYAAWHRKYRLLLELWRPLLEGLAVYAQVHEPGESGDALIEPVQMLLNWSTFISAVGMNGAAPNTAWRSGYQQFLEAAYAAIRKGPTLLHGGTPLAVGFEFVNPDSLRPYFLGHAYIRALHVALAKKSATYESSERFFNLVIRILRSSTRGLLRDQIAWDQPMMATRVYGWVDIVREAPQARVHALEGQPDAIDVLHFLATGKKRRGYDVTARGIVATVRRIVPQFWKEFETAISRHIRSAKLPRTATPSNRVGRLVAGWIGGTMALNLSTNGEASIIGWIPEGLAPLHALALRIDDAVWWVALAEEDFAKLIDERGSLPKFAPAAMRGHVAAGAISGRLLIDSYVSFAPSDDPSFSDACSPRLLPHPSFRLWNSATPHSLLHLEVAGERPGLIGPHLRVIGNENRLTLQYAGLSELRRDVRDALSSSELVDLLKVHAHADLARALEKSAMEEELVVSRVVANVERHILATLLQREPIGADLEMLERGVGVLPNAEKFGPLIAATYSAFALADASLSGHVRTLNYSAQSIVGKPVFDIDRRGFVRYRGLWGEA